MTKLDLGGFGSKFDYTATMRFRESGPGNIEVYGFELTGEPLNAEICGVVGGKWDPKRKACSLKVEQ